jgi:chitinase
MRSRRRFLHAAACGAAAFAVSPLAAHEALRPPLFGGQPLAFDPRGGRVVGVYVPGWESPSLLDRVRPGSITHVLHAFVPVCGPGQKLAQAAQCDARSAFELGGLADVRFDVAYAQLKRRVPGVQVLASIGGWGGSDPFFHLANDAQRRAVFVASAVAFLRRHPAFDGIDIDWEHPTGNGAANGVALGSPADGAGYAELMLGLRRAFDTLSAETGRRYLVTSAINTSTALVAKIDYRRAAEALDLVFMMSYDYHGPWTPTAGHHTRLRSGAIHGDASLVAGTQTMLAAGVPARKLVAGVAMYARGFSGVAAAQSAQDLDGASRDGVYPGEDGSLPYREIAARYLDSRGDARRGYTLSFDEATGSYALWNAHSRLYLGYDDPRAVIAKGRFAREEGLAGVFAWELSQDNGDLLNAMNLGVGHRAIQRGDAR